VTAVDELLAFLRACLDDDERVARAASPGPWKPNAEQDEVLAVDDVTVADGFALSGNQLRATVEHIARWDPARVLAKIRADRAILDWCERAIHVTEDDCYQLGVDDVVRLLAQPYAGQPGWRAEWRA
jgi:hypothetical protein